MENHKKLIILRQIVQLILTLKTYQEIIKRKWGYLAITKIDPFHTSKISSFPFFTLSMLSSPTRDYKKTKSTINKKFKIRVNLRNHRFQVTKKKTLVLVDWKLQTNYSRY